MSAGREDVNRRLLRARDLMDRSYAEPLDVAALARAANVSASHFAHTFKQTFGETPHRYLQRRRVERAMYLLRETAEPVTAICHQVGFSSLGTFSRTFSGVVGCSPSRYRERTPPHPPFVPGCFSRSWTRPSRAPVTAVPEKPPAPSTP